MVRRSAGAPPWRVPFVILAVVGGLTLGVLLSQVPAPPAALQPAVAPPAAVPPSSSPAPRPAVSTADVDTLAIETAVRATLAQIGTITQDTLSAQFIQVGDLTLHWTTHRVAVRTRRTAADAASALERRAVQTGGQVFARNGTLALGIVREGVRLTTHEVRFLPPAARARVAIIFDDAGGSLADVEEIIALHRAVTVAVLPGLRFSREVAERMRTAGLEVFLHLPLEPEDRGKNLGPGGVTGEMSDAEIAATVRAALASVPGAVGVNNHMGSKGTADERVMRAVLGVVQEQRLIWVDSVTSPRTVGGRLAADFGIRTAARDVFLDNEDEVQAIQAQIRRLIEVALKRGEAVAIGHAHRRTAQVLGQTLGEFDRLGIDLVPASELAR